MVRSKKNTYSPLINTLRPYFMIAPAMIAIGIFVIYPAIHLIQLSFMNINMLNSEKSRFVGLDNYFKIFARPDFTKSLQNSFVYTVIVVFCIISLALILAVWLNSRKSRLNSALRAMIFSPHIVSIVSISLIWLWMMEPNFGLFNHVLKSLGLPTLQWLHSSKTALPSVILVSVWKSVGYDTLLLIAALQNIPTSIYEAAKLDNARQGTIFFRIIIPMISPQLFFILIIRTIDSFKMFDTVNILTGGGPNNATSTLVYVIYKETLYNMRIGYAAAVGVILMILTGILTLFYFWVVAKKVHYQ